MVVNNSSVESYLAEGCGRCDRFQTADCKVHRWSEVLQALRALVLESGLVETMKWGSPCYTSGGKNVVMITSFNDSCALSFFKGVLLDAEQGVLEAPGPGSHHARLLKLRSLDDFESRAEVAKLLIAQAIAVEAAGKKVQKGPMEAMPEELRERLEREPEAARAFAALSPGRQRSHILFVAGASQSKTRAGRAEKCLAKIFVGKGYNER